MQNFRYVTYISSIDLQESLLNYRTNNLKAREQYRHSSQCEYDTRLHELRKCRSNARNRSRIISLASAMCNDLDFRSYCQCSRVASKFVKIAKQELTEFERRYHFAVIVVVYKLCDRHDVKDAFGESEGKKDRDTRLARARGRF